MSLSFIKKKKKIWEINNFEDIAKYLNIQNRELRIETLTPQQANNIDSFIRYWNIEDEENGKTFPEREPIKIYINSLGGSLEAALTIVNSISLSRTPVYTFNIGTVQREAFFVYLAGHKRLTYPNATFMYSNSILAINEEEKTNNESSFYSISAVNIDTAKEMKKLFLDTVGITENQYDKHCKTDWWFCAEDAFKTHLANEISRKHFHYVKES